MSRSGAIFVRNGNKVTQVSDIKYFLNAEGERVALDGPMTLGRHLDNDVLLAGEDVLDYHLRLEITRRGPKAIPLAEASLRVNGRDLADGAGLMPGDQLQIGQSVVTLEMEPCDPANPGVVPEPGRWQLCGIGSLQSWPVMNRLDVGRGDENGLQIDDDHISRRHASLIEHRGIVWIQDMGSSNGTYVNGERVVGASRLFHGDAVSFDKIEYQLVGQGAELTPVRRDSARGSAPLLPQPDAPEDPEHIDTTELSAVAEEPLTTASIPADSGAGAFLLGASDPVAGLTFRTRMGRTLIGRHESCDLVIGDRTVSAKHAELAIRSDGVTITNLMATNGTRVNGDTVQTARLHDGDVLRLGRVSLVFKEVPRSESARSWMRWTQILLLAGSLALAAWLLTRLL